jgi:cell division protein FtsZ
MTSYDIEAINAPSLRPKISVIGIGGAGGNMLNAIISEGIEHIQYIALNTDLQALSNIQAAEKIVLGASLTGGMGTGANPEIGKMAIEENLENVLEIIGDSDIVFLLAGLGGGTGSGVLPLLSKILQEKQILSIALVTKPFFFEGSRRMQVAQQAISKIEEYIDTLIIIPNQKLFEAQGMQDISLCNAFEKINRVMVDCIKAVVETIFSPGHINVDFADIKTTMSRMGRAIIGIGKGSGEKRAMEAIQGAIESPLLENNSLKGARSILLNIHGDSSLSLHEMNIIAGFIHDEAHPEAHIIVGSSINKTKEDDTITLTIIVTGFEDQLKARIQSKNNIHVHNQGSMNYNNIAAQKQNFYNQTSSSQIKNNQNFFQQNNNNIEKNNYDETKKTTESFSKNIDIPTFLRNQSIEK